MAPAIASELVRRYWVCNSFGNCRWRSNQWYDFGRWILLGALGLMLIVGLFLFSCLARRRRRRGAQPMYGTGWMAPAGKFNGGQGGQEMNGYQNQGYGPPPAGYGPPPAGYGPPPAGYGNAPPVPPEYGQSQQPQNTGTTFNPNDGYYGVQQPPHTYQRDGEPYVPPPGPPPGK